MRGGRRRQRARPPVLVALWAVAVVAVVVVAEPYACHNCNDISPRLQEFCQSMVKEGQPCESYQLVWRRLCRRTCLGVNRMKCEDAAQVCEEDPDCPGLCKMFFDELCPPVEDAADLAGEKLEEKKEAEAAAGGGKAAAAARFAETHEGDRFFFSGLLSSLLGKNNQQPKKQSRTAAPVTVAQKREDAKTLRAGEGQGLTMVKYVVRHGDYMQKIATAYQTGVDLIMRANPDITDPDLIFPGEILNVPIPSTQQTEYTDPCPGTPLH